MMFGYATRETDNYMPLALDIANRILQELAALRRESDAIPYLRPDAKAQVTIEYSDDDQPQRIDTIVISTQHDPFDPDDAANAGPDQEGPAGNTDSPGSGRPARTVAGPVRRADQIPYQPDG